MQYTTDKNYKYIYDHMHTSIKYIGQVELFIKSIDNKNDYRINISIKNIFPENEKIHNYILGKLNIIDCKKTIDNNILFIANYEPFSKDYIMEIYNASSIKIGGNASYYHKY
jgi:hypothetical protein